MTEPAKYLYGIIRCVGDRTFDEAGIEGCGVVHTVSHRDLAVVVSDTPAKQHERTRRNMLAHEKVLEAVMKVSNPLPVRFGTVADSGSPVDDIRKLLGSRYDEFDSLLKEMDGKVELGLKAFWRDEKAIFEEIIAENADIRSLRDSLSGKSPEAARFDRIRLGESVKEALDRKRSREAARMLLSLRPLAHAIRENEALADRIIVNAAFLVNKTRELEFDEAVSKLDEQFGERAILRYIGLAPPYNFVNIVVNWEDHG